MVKGVGIDLVEIDRFKKWTLFPKSQLLRIFSEDELSYAFASPCKTVERLAVRFAAKEAFLKALSPHRVQSVPFLLVCKAVQIKNGPYPTLDINWTLLQDYLEVQQRFSCLVSLTHSKKTAGAVVVLT